MCHENSVLDITAVDIGVLKINHFILQTILFNDQFSLTALYLFGLVYP